MKKNVILFCSLVIALHLRAQPVSLPVGEYLLAGEMETAAGFKLDSNGTFQFFFSYGALDRQARGTWRTEGERLVLNSEPTGGKDFQLTQAKHSRATHVAVFLSGAPPDMLRYFTVTGIANKKQVSRTADKKGRVLLPLRHADSLVIRFAWCPEKAFRYAAASPLHNQFSFRLLPSITDVVFDNFSFKLTPAEITGALPFSGEHICTFRLTSGNDRIP